MHIKDLPPHATLLAPTHQHGFLRVLFSSESVPSNIHLTSPSNWLIKEPIVDRSTQLFEAKTLLATLADDFPDFLDRFQDPQFIESCIQFHEDMDLYQIALTSLPQDTYEEKCLANIQGTLQVLKSHANTMWQSLDHVKTIDFSSIYILPTTYSPIETMIVEELRKLGATFLEIKNIKPSIQFYRSVNIRQEVEACVQFILSQNIKAEDCTIQVCDDAILPFIKQSFFHYKVPYTTIQEQTCVPTIKVSAILLAFYLQQNQNTLQAVLNSSLFQHPALDHMVSYLQLFQADISKPFQHIQTTHLESELINSFDKERLDRLEKQSEEVRSIVYPLLQPLINASSFKEVLQVIYELIYQQMKPNKKHLQQLQQLFQNCYPYLQKKTDLEFLYHYLQDYQTSIQAEEYLGAIITNINHPMPYRPYLFVLGCTQSNYPNFSICKAPYDEDYRAMIPYPKMEDRYQNHLHQLEQNLCNCEQLYLSYAQGDFNGKGQEASLEIELFSQRKPIAYPLISIHQQIQRDPLLTTETAAQLFFHDNTIHGSISAFEQYVNCPFSYFIKYGLKIREPLDNTFSANRIGTLSHYVLETLVSKYGKAYSQVDSSQIRAIIHEELTKAANIYIPLKDSFAILEERLFQNLSTMFEILSDMEEHTAFHPLACEFEFQHDLSLENGITLHLKGIIDRIDVCNDMIRIIDYKSSHKSLSETKVFAAQQLQLLTYAIIAQDYFQKEPAGTYYFSLKNENITADAGKLKRRPASFIPYDNTDYKEMRYAAHRLEGWTLEDTFNEYMDDDARHIKGFSINKEEQINVRRVYHIDGLRAMLMDMYTIITQRIKNGQIELTPSQNACLYCAYRPICRYQGLTHEKEKLVEPDETLYKKGGKTYDNMES